MESRAKKVEKAFCHERDEQGKNHHKAKCEISHQRKTDPRSALESLHCQHVLRISRQRESLSRYGLSFRW